MSNLYLPSEPPVYNYVYKFDQTDYVLIPGMVCAAGTMITLIIIDVMNLAEIKQYIISECNITYMGINRFTWSRTN